MTELIENWKLEIDNPPDRRDARPTLIRGCEGHNFSPTRASSRICAPIAISSTGAVLLTLGKLHCCLRMF